MREKRETWETRARAVAVVCVVETTDLEFRNLAWIFPSRRSRRRQSALISEEKKLAPTDVGGYALRPFPT